METGPGRSFPPLFVIRTYFLLIVPVIFLRLTDYHLHAFLNWFLLVYVLNELN